jgi:ParB/RepB/Spo0J family partition protein
MAKIKLTKTAVEAAQAQPKDVELRDTVVPGFLCKITPTGRRVFMLQYRTNSGQPRKPALGLYGELTVEQARVKAQDWLAEVRRGGDPGGAKAEARKAPTMAELCKKFMEDYSKKRNKVSTQEGYQGVIDRNIIPLLGRKKVHDVKRPDIAGLMEKLAYKPTEANKTFGVLRKMFNLAEVWDYRPDGTNPCRHVPMYPSDKETRLIVDEEMVRIFRHLEKLEAEGLENYVIPLAIRLQFEFAARRSEICPLEWSWLDFENRRVVWPDSKVGGISKPMSEEAYRLLSTAPRREGCPYVLPSPNDPTKNLILVPLLQLLPRRSKRNVRTTPRQSIPELAASIARIGLLQNLIVILSADGEAYEVVAGDRRLTALKLLAKKKRIPADYEVPCLLVADGSARTVSLAENLMREQMHPADQFEAFAALVKEGRPIEDIAADFGVSPLVVQRRLKLANVSPRLMADYRTGTVTLEQLIRA